MNTPVTPARPAAPGTFTGRHMLIVMLGFFGTVIAANLVMAISASTTWTGLVVENSYVASQQFQGKLDALHAQQALGWTSSFTYTPGTGHFIIRDAAGKPVQQGDVVVKVSRPVGEKYDQTVTLTQVADGEYDAPLDLHAGVWDAVVTSDPTASGSFEYHERFKVGQE